jgi:hypothetical protein
VHYIVLLELEMERSGCSSYDISLVDRSVTFLVSNLNCQSVVMARHHDLILTMDLLSFALER